MHPRPTAGPGEEDAALAHVGRLLSEDFLAGPAGAALASQVAAAESLNETHGVHVRASLPAWLGKNT